MRNASAVLVGLVTLATALVATSLPGSSVGIRGLDNPISEIGEKAFRQISTCLSPANAQLNVLFVLDASSSLPEDTDKDGVRGDILAQSIAQLVSVTETRPVNIAISSFDLDYKEQAAWESLDQKSLDKISRDIPSWVSSWWGRGGGTDWEEALSGGAQTMRNSPESTTACKMMIWLTDGGINVDGPRAIAPNKSAMENICGTNPVNGDRLLDDSIVAQLRSENVYLIGVLLQSEDYLNSLSNDPARLADEKSRFSYMRPVTEGTGNVNNAAFTQSAAKEFDYECGNIPIPEGQANGALLSGSSPISLAFAFADLNNAIRGGEREDLGKTFPVTFDIEPGVNSLNVQLAGRDWSLNGPEGPVLRSGADGLDGIVVSQEGDLANIRIEGQALPPGEWTLDVQDPFASAVIYRNIMVDGNLEAVNPELQAGETSEITVEFIDAVSSELVPNDLYVAAPLEMSLTEGQMGSKQLACLQDANVLRFTCTVTPFQVGKAKIAATFVLKTRSGRIQYIYRGDFSRDVLPDAKFPAVSPTSVQLSEIVGKNGRATGAITINGPSQGSGSVCVPTSDDLTVISDVIERSDSFFLDWTGTVNNCVAVAQGEDIEVSLSIGTGIAASGQTSLSLPFVLTSSDSVNELKQEVTVTFSTVREGTPNPFVFLGLLLIGFGMPIGLLYLQARSASRLSLKGLQVANIPVRVRIDGGVVRLSRSTPGDSELFQMDDWQWFSSKVEKTRSFTTPSGAKLITKTPKNPLGALSAFAEAPSGARVITSEGAATNGVRGKIGLSPANQWILTIPTSDLLSEQVELSGQLVAFANPNGGALEEVNRNLSLSAQDGMLLGSLLTVRESMMALSDKESSKSRDKVKKVKNPKSDRSTKPVAPVDQTVATDPSPFDSLLGNDSASGSANAKDNPSVTKPSSSPPPKDPGSGMNNPFENL